MSDYENAESCDECDDYQPERVGPVAPVKTLQFYNRGLRPPPPPSRTTSSTPALALPPRVSKGAVKKDDRPAPPHNVQHTPPRREPPPQPKDSSIPSQASPQGRLQVIVPTRLSDGGYYLYSALEPPVPENPAAAHKEKKTPEPLPRVRPLEPPSPAKQQPRPDQPVQALQHFNDSDDDDANDYVDIGLGRRPPIAEPTPTLPKASKSATKKDDVDRAQQNLPAYIQHAPRKPPRRPPFPPESDTDMYKKRFTPESAPQVVHRKPLKPLKLQPIRAQPVRQLESEIADQEIYLEPPDENFGNDGKASKFGPEMQKIYHKVCQGGTRKVYQTRLMIIGHFAAGKTSLKRSLLHEGFIREHITTDGIDRLEETVVVDVETVVNWSKVRSCDKEEFATEAAKEIQTRSTTMSRTNDTDDEQREGIGEGGPLMSSLKFEGVKDDVLAKLAKLEKESGQLRLTIWDFGGQHVYYTSHQTFLTHRAIYLLVMDITKALGDVIEKYIYRPLEHTGLPRTAMDFLDYWLNSVHTHLTKGEQSNAKCDPPVIIVLTKVDMLDKDARRRAFMIQEFIEDIDDHLRGKPYYHHVRDIIAVSNLDPQDQGINSLRRKIFEVAKDQAYWGEKRPTKWLLLADELKEKASHQVEPMVQLSDVHQAARNCGVQDEEVQTFLRFHHNLGDIIYFDEQETKDIVILSPQWLASQFSKVITQEKFLEKISDDQRSNLKRGILSDTTAAKLCGTSQPEALVNIMEKFNMLVPCNFQSETGRQDPAHLVPCLLPRVTYQTVQEQVIPRLHFKCLSKVTGRLTNLSKRGFIPHGLYHRLVSHCCRVRNWTYHEAMIFYDYLVIDVEGFYISLHMVNNGITLSAFKFRGQPADHSKKLSEVRQQVQSMIEDITKDVFPTLQCVPCLECNCSVPVEPEPKQSFAQQHSMKARGYISVKGPEAGLDSSVVCDHHRMLVETKPWDIWFTRAEDRSKPASVELDVAAEGKKLQEELQPHMETLLDAIPYKIQDKLVEANLLSLDSIEDIRMETTTRQRNLRMFTTLFSCVKNRDDRQAAKMAVCEGLCESSQFCPFKGKEEPATASQQGDILRLYRRLVEDMEVTPVLTRLYQAEIADQHTQELVLAEKTRRDMVNKLLFFMKHKHRAAQKIFMDILKETNWWIFDNEPPVETCCDM